MGEIVAEVGGSEVPTAANNNNNGGFDSVAAMGAGINMTNCYQKCKRFFERFERIDSKVLIGYWMKAGYLGPVYSAEKAFRRGEALLLELINQEGWLLKHSEEDGEVIVLADSDDHPVRCRHDQGLFCSYLSLGLAEFVDLDWIGEVELTDGLSSKKKKSSGNSADLLSNHSRRKQFSHPSSSSASSKKNKEHKYIANSHPSPDSFKRLLQNLNDPSVLLLRGCESVLQADAFPFEKFAPLAVLEISGFTRLDSFLVKAISELNHLQSLNLSNLPITTLMLKLSRLTALRRLILTGSFDVAPASIQSISYLCCLQYLDLSGLLIEELPYNFFYELKELQWVILRGCSKLVYLPTIKPLKKLKMLDLSHCSALQKIATTVLQNPHLEMLNLSYTAMSYIPALRGAPHLTHLILKDSKILQDLKLLEGLKVVDLSGAESVRDIYNFDENKSIRELNLSRTVIRSIYFLLDLIDLRSLILQGCTRFENIPVIKDLTNLEVLDMSNCEKLSDLPEDLSDLRNLKELDLSGCNSLQGLREGVFDRMTCLEKLDLSKTRVSRLPSFANLVNLHKLSLRGLRLDSLDTLASLLRLVELDLSGIQITSLSELNLDFFNCLQRLQILNLSHTSLVTLPDMSNLVRLKELLLANCQNLKVVSDLRTLTNLETLDISLPKDSITDGEETDSSAGTVRFVSAPTKLQKLVLAYRPGLLKLIPLTALENLEYLDIRGTNDIDFVRAHSTKMEKLEEVVVGWDSTSHREYVQARTSKLDELHVVSTFYQSGFDRFKAKFTEIESLILSIQMGLNSAPPDTIVKANIETEAFKRHFQSMLTDLQYLVRNIDLLESSPNPKSCEEFLHELVDAATHPSAYDFSLDSTNLDILLRLVLKLKLLVPTKQVDDLEASEIANKEKKLQFTRRKNKDTDVTDNVETSQGRAHLLSSYENLNETEKKCLQCFSGFPYSDGRHENKGLLESKGLVIKKRMLVHWWVGEGFIGSPESTSNQNLNLDPRRNSNCKQDSGLRTVTSVERYDTEQVSATGMLKKSTRTEEIGKQALRSLEEKRFIETVMNKKQDSGSCCMNPLVHSFVTDRAKEEGFFDVGQDSKLAPGFTRSKRACLVKSQDNSLSSCKLWANYTSSAKRLESFNDVRALLNVNEPIVDIRVEWFSKMKDLLVLHLGGWGFRNGDHIEVMDQKFMEDLERMKRLRLLSLQGFTAITKLPDSVCKLTNLRILNLRECSYLEELPDDIGSLKNLIHLDVTHCRGLSMLPKGVHSLSKMEVLKGFMIIYQGGGQQHEKACTLRDLLKLQKLEKLSITVNIDKFPNSKDVQVLKEMRSLWNLKITWETSYIINREAQNETANEASRCSGWKELLKCGWGSQAAGRQTDADKKTLLRSKHLDNLKKLALCCIPLEAAPEWLDPSELQNLEKLYIVGGKLQNLRGSYENTWNVKTLRLKYLRSMKILWPLLRDIYPNMSYLENHECDNLTHFPCDDEGVWRVETE